MPSGPLGVGDSEIYIGLMSGTSLDGVDGVIADLSGRSPTVLAHASLPFPRPLKLELLALNSSGSDELQRSAVASNKLAELYADVVSRLLGSADSAIATRVRAIGAHGQTVRHRPSDFQFTIQLNNPALLAELTGIDVVADFRSRDVAAGGQGAPLVPAFHRAVFGRAGESIAVLNIGGISNLSLLRADGSTSGFDCGPGNALMDYWCETHTGKPFDDSGSWARSGRVVPELLASLNSEPFLSKAPPKSTGRDLFNVPWLEAKLNGAKFSAEDLQATLTEFTAASCADHLHRYAADAKRLVVCGGGAFNTLLMERIAALSPGVKVVQSGEMGVPPQQVEALAFAWLAQRTVLREPGNLPEATGARGLRVLGAIYPA